MQRAGFRSGSSTFWLCDQGQVAVPQFPPLSNGSKNDWQIFVVTIKAAAPVTLILGFILNIRYKDGKRPCLIYDLLKGQDEHSH